MSYGLSAPYFYVIKSDIKNLKIDFQSNTIVTNYIFLSIRYIKIHFSFVV